MTGVGGTERGHAVERAAHIPPGESGDAEAKGLREQTRALEELVRKPPTAPDAATAPRPAAAGPVPPLRGPPPQRQSEPGPLTGGAIESQLQRAGLPSQQWPAIQVGQGVVIERRDRASAGYRHEVYVISRLDESGAELLARTTGQSLRVALDGLRNRIAWQYGHSAHPSVVEEGSDVTWTLKTEPNLTAPDPPALATEAMREAMRTSARRLDAALRAATETPEARQRWERVMTLQSRQNDLARQQRDLKQALDTRLANRPLRLTVLVDGMVPTDAPRGLAGVRAGLKALAGDATAEAYQAQIAALDEQMVDLSRAAALIASGETLDGLAKTSTDPMVLAMAREEAGESISPAELLGQYLDNAEAALARGSTSAALIATAAALQPYLLMDSEQHGSMHRLPGPDDRREPSLTMAANQLIVEGKLGKRPLVQSAAQLAELVKHLSELELISIDRRRDELQRGTSQELRPIEGLSQTERGRRRNQELAQARTRLNAEIERVRAVERSGPHRTFLASKGSALLSRVDDLSRRALRAATNRELREFGRGVADVFDSVNTWVMAGAMAATRGIGVATFARNMPQVGELLLAYRAGRASAIGMRAAANRLAVGAVGTAATFTTLNNLALDAIGQERYIDWSPSAFATNLLALTAFDYVRARSFVRNIESAPAIQGSLGLRLHDWRLIGQHAAEQLAAGSAVGIAGAYLRDGNFDAAEQVLTANVQFLVAMAAVGKLAGNTTLVAPEVTRIERLLAQSRRLPPHAIEQRRALVEQAIAALQSVTDAAMPGRAAQLVAEVLATSRVKPRQPSAANVPADFADKLRNLVTPLLADRPFTPGRVPGPKPGARYVAVFPSHPLDGDSAMSALASVRALRAAGVEAYVVMSQPLPRNLRPYAPHADEVLSDAATVLRTHRPAFAIGVDGQSFFGRNAEAMAADVPMLRIDHHEVGLQPSRNVGPRSSTWVDPQAQSSGQLVADVITLLGQVHAQRISPARSPVGLDGASGRSISAPLLVAAYTDVWGGAARPLMNANATTIGFMRALASRVDVAGTLSGVGGLVPAEVRRALQVRTSSTFYGGGGAPRSATELSFTFREALAVLERVEGKQRGLDHHRDLAGRLVDRLESHAQLGDVVFAVIPEVNPAGVAGSRFFLRSYQHSDAAELTATIREVAADRFPDRSSLIDAGGKAQVGGGWMPLAADEMSALVRASVTRTLAAWDERNGSPAGRRRRDDTRGPPE